MTSTVAMSTASPALVGKPSGADAGTEAAAGPLAVVDAGQWQRQGRRAGRPRAAGVGLTADVPGR
ncbi:hypothetical protein ABT215_40605, partial [Streptomyces sp900105755]